MPSQEVYFDSSALTTFLGEEGEEIIFPLKYRTSDGKSTTGLNVEIYYDSEILTPLSVEDQLQLQ